MTRTKGARAQPSGHWDGQQEQHGTGRQFSGGRRVTTGATGEATNNSKTDREEARGGERGMHARAKWLKTRSTGGGISGGGAEGGPKPSMGQPYIVLNLRARV